VRDDPVLIEPAPTAPTIVPPQPAPHLHIVPKPKHSVTRTCCWPLGEPGTKTFRFCDDAELVEGKPYCLEHCQRAYVNFGRGKLMNAA
jgi:GcrA cell cycle regulator